MSSIALTTTQVESNYNLLIQNVTVPGKIVYFSYYIFDSDLLVTLNKFNFASGYEGALPPFDYFYTKIFLPTVETKWAIVYFVEDKLILYTLSNNFFPYNS